MKVLGCERVGIGLQVKGWSLGNSDFLLGDSIFYIRVGMESEDGLGLEEKRRV